MNSKDHGASPNTTAIGSMEEIILFTTGGTIDKVYFDRLSEYQTGNSVAEGLLRIAGVTFPYSIVEVLRKDSLEFTDDDRAALFRAVASAPSSRIVVTHGTDTMTQSAHALAPISGKTIVLTGALAPARFRDSDAAFNLGMAFAAAQTATHGVYIAMNGHVFRGDHVRKERTLSKFVALKP
jgi:L-asparaginase